MSLFNFLRPKARPAPITRVKNIESIKAHEGIRLKAYLPTPNDVWTIGYGHTSTAHKGMVITHIKAEALLRGDLKWVEDAIAEHVQVPLSQPQFDAVASLIYNIGATGFSKSTVCRRINASDFEGAADAFLMWNKQRNRRTGKLEVLRGLTKRRQVERAMFLKGSK